MKHRKSFFYGLFFGAKNGAEHRKTIENAKSLNINDLQAPFSMFSMFFYVFYSGAGTIVEIEKAYRAFLFL